MEALARGLISRVRITDPEGYQGHVIDDVVPYDTLAREYSPRRSSTTSRVSAASGQYLEQPVLQYTIGTRITPEVAKDLSNANISSIVVNKEPPPFEPFMTRVMDVTGSDPDWMVRLGGFNLKKNLMDAVTRGSRSETGRTSYIPALAAGSDLYSKYTKKDG